MQEEPRDRWDPCTIADCQYWCTSSTCACWVGSGCPDQRGPRAKAPGPMLGCRCFIPSNLNASRLISRPRPRPLSRPLITTTTTPWASQPPACGLNTLGPAQVCKHVLCAIALKEGRATGLRDGIQDSPENVAVRDVQPGQVSGYADGAKACDAQLLLTKCRPTVQVQLLSWLLAPTCRWTDINIPTHGIDVIP